MSMLDSLDDIFVERRGFVVTTKPHGTICVMCSGGMDSTILMERLLGEYNCNIVPLFIKRGARAECYEESSFDYYIKYFKNKYPGQIVSETKLMQEIPLRQLKYNYPVEVLATKGYPMRDMLITALGVHYCNYLRYNRNLAINKIYTASLPEDKFNHSKREAYRLFNLLVCFDTGDWSWEITSPFVERLFTENSKAELIPWAIKRGLPLQYTRTCIDESMSPCGKCPECLWREEAFVAAGYTDPGR